VRELHLSTGQPFLHVQLQAHKGKRERNVSGVLVGVLGREGIHYALMNESRIRMREGVCP
jgi:hypothetical protein